MAQKQKGAFPAAAGILVILAAVLVLAGIIIWKKSYENEIDTKDAVLLLNDEKVSEEEYRMLAESLKNKIFMQYSTEEVNQENFWEREVNDAIPWKQLDNLVTEELKYNYTLKQYAIKLGVTEPYTFEQLMENQKAENQSRADSVESETEVTYGLKEYDDLTYYQSWYSSLETGVTAAIIRDYADITEEECKDYYEKNKEEYTYEAGVEILYIEIADNGSNPRYAEAMADAAVKSAKEGASAEELQENYPEAEVQVLKLTSFDTGEEKNGMYSMRWDIASQMAAGEVYGPYEEAGMLCVIKCIDRTDGGMLDFAEVQEIIKRHLQVCFAAEEIEKEKENMNLKKGGISAKDIIISCGK